MADQQSQPSQVQNSIGATNNSHHTHNGLDSPQLQAGNIVNMTKIAASGSNALLGNVTLAGAGITTLTQSGQTITITSTETGFGGTGVDGALSITSGTTTINCANAAVVVKNYTSISITGSGKLGFSNPNANGTIIVLRSQGNVTLTSSSAPMIDASSMGATGGAGGALVPNNPGANGSPGNAVLQPYIWNNDACGGVGGSASVSGGSGAAGANYTLPYLYVTDTSTPIWKKFGYTVTPGAGGAGGAGGESHAGGTGGTGGAGGNGGGGLYIECGGAFNFTTNSGISVAGQIGQPGANGTDVGGTGTGTGGGGGAGGSGGWCVILYETLTANTGTVTISGGTGGVGGNTVCDELANVPAGGGAGGGSGLVAGGAGGNAANPGANGSAGNNSKTTGAGGGLGGTGGTMSGSHSDHSAAGGGGGGGSAGELIIAQNVFF